MQSHGAAQSDVVGAINRAVSFLVSVCAAFFCFVETNPNDYDITDYSFIRTGTLVAAEQPILCNRSVCCYVTCTYGGRSW